MSGKSINPKLIEDLKNKDFRRSYLASMIATTRAYQIDALRRKHKLTQSRLGIRANKPQNVISRLENPDYQNCNVKTLLDIAASFDVALILKFVPFSRFLEEFSDVSQMALDAVTFEEEFTETHAATNISKATQNIVDLIIDRTPMDEPMGRDTVADADFDVATTNA